MQAEWNKDLISAIVSRIKTEITSRSIKFHYEGAYRITGGTEGMELRIIQSGWTQVDAQTWRTRLAINILCQVPSGENTANPANVYRIEELIGIAQEILSQGFNIEGLGCLTPDIGRGGSNLEQFRPRQIKPATNVVQASTTGYFKLEKTI